MSTGNNTTDNRRVGVYFMVKQDKDKSPEENDEFRKVVVVYSDEFLEIFYALENVVKSYEDMIDIYGPISHARFLVEDYKSKFNLDQEFVE